MGLAASQARYLSLTARKTNVEYEGQQVNQQRTALANQSAGLFNQMLALNVPTPPSASDYTKTYYTYSDPVNGEMTIDYINIDQEQSNQFVTYADIRCTQKSSDFTVNTRKASELENLGKIVASKKDVTTGEQVYYMQTSSGVKRTIDGPYPNSNLDKKLYDKDAGKQYFEFTDGNTVYYIEAASEKETLDEFMARFNDNKDSIDVHMTQSYTKSESVPFKAQLNKANDGTGRWESAEIRDKNGEIVGVFKLTQQTVQDTDAYDAAMETYVAEKAIYEKTVEDINAETLVIQQQDKTLELHLDQLDTEQQAIQTELDAVKKVIDKNIEETFKTFA